jgi:hypothetical protein
MSQQAKQDKPVEAMPNDVGEWGEVEDRGSADYGRPLVIGGEKVNLDELPQFGPSKAKPKRPAKK